MASKNDRSFKIETISGNKEEIENLILQTSYKSNDFIICCTYQRMVPQIQIISLFRDLIAPNEPMILRKYIDEHRNFMRGKEFGPRKYFEDKARLIYTTFLDDGRKGDGEMFKSIHWIKIQMKVLPLKSICQSKQAMIGSI